MIISPEDFWSTNEIRINNSFERVINKINDDLREKAEFNGAFTLQDLGLTEYNYGILTTIAFKLTIEIKKHGWNVSHIVGFTGITLNISLNNQ